MTNWKQTALDHLHSRTVSVKAKDSNAKQLHLKEASRAREQLTKQQREKFGYRVSALF